MDTERRCIICGNSRVPYPAAGLCRKCYCKRFDWAKANPEKHAARVARWRASHPAETKQINAAQHVRHKEKRNAQSKTYRAKNLEKVKALQSAWSKANPEAWRLANAARRAARKQAVPAWAASEWERFAMQELYDLAIRRTRTTRVAWHVDHIVPLQSAVVCGLHCVANLRVVPALENHIKGNRQWPDMPLASQSP